MYFFLVHVDAINALNCDLPYSGDDRVSVLLYADNIVLLSDNEANMQTMLDCLDQWCITWGLTINYLKSKALHVRAASAPRTEYNFVCGNSSSQLTAQYKYLRVLFTNI